MKIIVTKTQFILKWLLLTSIGLVFWCPPSHSETKVSVEELENQLKSKPNDKKVMSDLGKALYHKGDKDRALELLKKAIVESDPNSYLLVAQIYREQKNYLDEVRILNLMLPKHPNYPRGHVLLGDAYVNLNKPDDAIVKYRQAIDISPKYESAYWGLFKVYEYKKNNYESRIILLDLIKNFGNRAKYLNPLCRLYSVDSFFEDSITFCQKAIEVDPKFVDNHIYLALTYKYAQNTQQAEKIIKSAASSFPRSEFAQQTAGEIMTERQNWEEASKYYLACTKRNKKNVSCQSGLALASFNIGKYDMSNRAFLAACLLDRKTVTEYKRQAAVLRINKKTDWFKKFTDNITKCY
ncbi:MAG: tetratricopeptide repeat protein [Bdellovibrionales bacterium]|nr:tetratricopeptide repeat protein [Bdellovibrionales bacterium]